ncbi:MAG: DUF11 domain-containing protein [Longimicrobiales bacterium]
MRRVTTLVLGLALTVSACMDATDVELLEVRATGLVFGQAFLDLNGSGAVDLGDRAIRNGTVLLIAPGTSDTIDQTTTDTLGVFVLDDVPLGTYRLGLDSAAIFGDSLITLGSGATVNVELADTAQVNLGATYPVLTIEQVRNAAPGRRVFTSGIALNQRQPFSDGTVWFKAVLAGDTAYLRATNVDRTNPAVSIGDSVRLLGTTGEDNGQPILDAVGPIVLVGGAQIVLPAEATVAQARVGAGGALDGGLVRIRNVEITDTATVSNDFHFWAYAGADSIEVVFRSFLGISTAAVRPDTVIRITEAVGLLDPVEDGAGNVRWRLVPRAGSELAYLTKSANVVVGTSYDVASATAGDTVEIRVTARNVGPQTATGVQVSDTIPSALTFISASATRGTYNPGTRLWTVGDLTLNATADTLRILAEVTGGPGTATNRAWLRALLREVETNPFDDTASAALTIP